MLPTDWFSFIRPDQINATIPTQQHSSSFKTVPPKILLILMWLQNDDPKIQMSLDIFSSCTLKKFLPRALQTTVIKKTADSLQGNMIDKLSHDLGAKAADPLIVGIFIHENG